MTNGQPDDLEDWYACEQGAERLPGLPSPAIAKIALAISVVPLALAAHFIIRRRSTS